MRKIFPSSPLAIIFITIFIDLLGFGLIIPALPFYAESFGASYITIGLLSMSYSLMQFIFAPLWGRISDRVGRRPIILLSLFGSCSAFLMFGFADSLIWLFIARSLAGILSSASIPTAQAFVADSTSQEDRAKGMGLIGAAFGLGFIFGPAVGGVLTKWGYGAPAFAAAGLAGLNFIWAYFRLPESLKEKNISHTTTSPFAPDIWRDTFSVKPLAILLAIFFLNVYAFSNMESTFALFCEHRIGLDAIHVGLLLMEVGVIASIIQGLLTGKLTKRFGEIKLVIAGLFVMMAGLFLTVFVYSVVEMILIVPLYAIGSSLCGPAVMSLISRSAPADRQGATMGVSQSLGALARVIGPPSATGLFQLFSPAAPYIAGAALLFIATLLSATKMRIVLRPVIQTKNPVEPGFEN